MNAAQPPLIIAGGGLAGCLAATAMVRSRSDVPILLIEQGQSFGGNHVWSFFDSDVEQQERSLLDQLSPRRWADHEVRFPGRRRVLGIGYNSVRSADLDSAVRRLLTPAQCRLGRRIVGIGVDHVTVDGGERIAARGVIDARGADKAMRLSLGWQKFVGRTFRYAGAHRCSRPVIMDATVDQSEGYRFVYSLPFSDSDLMLEDTYYSTSPLLDTAALGAKLDAIAGSFGEGAPRCLDEEAGVLPVVLGGDLDDLWPGQGTPPIARLGLRGGFFHPTTGYSLADAARNALLLATQPRFDSAALHAVYRGKAAALWKERRFFQLLNRMLFHAAAPDQRYRVLQHFYRLPEPVIARFYAARLSQFDKLRILSGRPPVPIGRAIAAIRRKAA